MDAPSSSSSAADRSFEHFLRQSLRALQREAPLAYAELCAGLSLGSVRVEVDAEQLALSSGATGVLVRKADPAFVHAALLRTQSSVLKRLVRSGGPLTKYILDDSLMVRGSVDQIAGLYAALNAFLQGAVRSPSLPKLLDDYMEEREPSGPSAATDDRKETRTMPEASDAKPKCVTIFGAGITGLTVAHELVERGFRVQVWEKQTDDRYPERGCDVGGLARTQWASAAWPDKASSTTALPPWKERQTRAIRQLPQNFYISKVDNEEAKLVALGENGATEATEVGKEFVNALITLNAGGADPYHAHLYCEAQMKPSWDGDDQSPEERVKWVMEKLAASMPADFSLAMDSQNELFEQREATLTAQHGKDKLMFRVSIVILDDFPEDLPASYVERISFRVREHWFPGEHGFRFFPSFYHHLFDTMKRTPLLETVDRSDVGPRQERSVTVNPSFVRYVESGQNAFDNLHPMTVQVLGYSDGRRPSVLSRFAPKSFEELREWLRATFESGPATVDNGAMRGKKRGLNPDTEKKVSLGLSPRDTARFALKMFQYLTSCSKRRKAYEALSWAQYLDVGETFTKAFVEAVNAWPEALVAMDAQTVDARTQGSILAQLAIDNLKPAGYRDGTLNGPTSEAWLSHWRRYLEAQGVEFIHGKLDGFTLATPPAQSGSAAKMIWPKVTCFEPRYFPNKHGAVPLRPGYWVLALDAASAQTIAKEYTTLCRKEGRTPNRDLEQLTKVDLLDPSNPSAVQSKSPTGQLRHMLGIQFYFDQDINWVDGHVYYPRSAWGLSSISQIRAWRDRPDWQHGYRGVLSVCMTIFDEEANVAGDAEPELPHKTAWDSSASELAQGVWNQIREGLGRPVPEPRYWRLDSGFKESPDGRGWINHSPLQINPPGTWPDRPGGDPIERSDDSARASNERTSSYCYDDMIVAAGTFMKTHTRLTTMEAANESARHAVNAILDHVETQANREFGTLFGRCDIWPVEDREIDDFKFLKELDEELFNRGLGHLCELLDLDQHLAYSLRGSRPKVEDPYDPLWVLDEISSILKNEYRRYLGDQRA